MWKEFKEFAMKGSVIDLAVGVVIGGAFGKIVTSLVNDLIMPILSVLTAGLSFADLKYVITPASKDQAGNAIAEVAIRYGSFIQNIIDFLIIAFSIFLAVKLINKARKKQEPLQEPAPAPTPTETELLTEIRDLLKSNQK